MPPSAALPIRICNAALEQFHIALLPPSKPYLVFLAPALLCCPQTAFAKSVVHAREAPLSSAAQSLQWLTGTLPCRVHQAVHEGAERVLDYCIAAIFTHIFGTIKGVGISSAGSALEHLLAACIKQHIRGHRKTADHHQTAVLLMCPLNSF